MVRRRQKRQENRASHLKLNSARCQARVQFCARSHELRSTPLSVPGNRCLPRLQDYWKKTGKAEEFFDMVATIQARRLNDQRADFAGPEVASEENSGISEDQLYDTILAHQSQRLEDQRTEPPIPVGIQGLLDLLLTAQGTRMEDQRSALPPGLAAPTLLGRQPSFLHGV
ncbi:G-protein-signaling modulator 3 [Ahaetulla prasina]|uniref:G-protein-signaling modulator 3 n=1 Tax=Ahaetulla prasina TaxID=499056 RepID=UPI002649F499|nr:G-protein-signaling modulator 3 [Ahaetulla prasina]